MIRYLINNKNTIKLITNTSKCFYTTSSRSTTNKEDDHYYDEQNLENQDFNWLNKRIDKKVSTYIRESPSSNQVEEKHLKVDKEEKTFDKKFEHYFNLLNEDFLKEELKNISEEIQKNSPIDRSNLSLTTLIRVCGKIQDEDSRIKEVLKRLLSLNNINQNTITTIEKDAISRLKFTLSQAHIIMRDFLLRSNSIMVEQVFKFIFSNKDRFNDIENSNLINETYYILIESYSNDGEIKKCLDIVNEMKLKLKLELSEIDNLKINRLICIGYSNSNQPELALEHYSSSKDSIDDLVILNSILGCFSRQSKIEKMEMVYGIIGDDGDHNTIQYLVEGYLKVGNTVKSIELINNRLESLPITTQTYNQVFTKLGKQNKLNEMMKLFNESMMKQGRLIIESLPIETDFDKLSKLSDLVTNQFKPNINTINILIDACCQCNNIEMAYQLFNELIPKYNLNASSETYSILEAISFKLKRTDLYRKYCVDYFHIIKKDD